MRTRCGFARGACSRIHSHSGIAISHFVPAAGGAFVFFSATRPAPDGRLPHSRPCIAARPFAPVSGCPGPGANIKVIMPAGHGEQADAVQADTSFAPLPCADKQSGFDQFADRGPGAGRATPPIGPKRVRVRVLATVAPVVGAKLPNHGYQHLAAQGGQLSTRP